MGVPGCPDLACSTASIAKVRIVSMQIRSRSRCVLASARGAMEAARRDIAVARMFALAWRGDGPRGLPRQLNPRAVARFLKGSAGKLVLSSQESRYTNGLARPRSTKDAG